MKRNIKITIITFLFSVFALPLFAQDEIVETPGASFLEIIPDAQSAALGAMGNTVASGAFGIFNNAATNVFAPKKFGLGASLSARKDFSDGNMYSIGGFFKLNDKNGISAGLRYFSNPIVNLANKTITPTEMAVDLAYGYKFFDNFSAALTFRFVNSNMDGLGVGKAKSFGGDLGLYYENSINFFEGGKWNFGLQASNLGTKLKYNDKSYSMPARLKIGGSALLPFSDNHILALTANVAYRLLPSSFSTFECGLGAEYNLYKYAFLRAGYHIGDETTGFGNFATLGAGVSVAGIKLDASYYLGVPEQEFKNILFFTLSASF